MVIYDTHVGTIRYHARHVCDAAKLVRPLPAVIATTESSSLTTVPTTKSFSIDTFEVSLL